MLSSLRSIYYASFVALWTLLCSFIVGLLVLVPPRGELSQLLVRRLWVAVILWVCGARVVISGSENVDKNRPCILMSNHQSHVDIMTIFRSNPINLRFVAKHTLFFIPFFGWYLWYAGYIPINRKNRESAIRSLDRAAEKIRQGISVVTFPEGTRSPDGLVQEFKKGPFMLALKARVPILPVSIFGSNRVLPKKGFRIRPGTIFIHYGKPIDVSFYTIEERDRLMEDVRRVIIQNQAALQDAGGRQGDQA